MKTSSLPSMILILMCVSGLAGSAVAQTSVLFNFESGTVSGWTLPSWPVGNTLWADSTYVHNGTYALGCGHTLDADWLFPTNSTMPTNDFTAFETISYWVRSDHYNTGNDWIKLVLVESSGEQWAQEHLAYPTSTYERIAVDLKSKYVSTNGFAVEQDGVDWVLDLTNVVAMRFIIRRPVYTGNSSYTNFFLDDIELSRKPLVAELSLSTHATGFGAVNPSPSDHRYVSDSVYVDYTVTGYTDPWRIELYSEHASGAMGLVGEGDASYILPFKCWYGGTNDTPPDPESDTEWANGWSYVTDQTNTWHPTLAASTNDPIMSGFQLRFAMDAAGTYTQVYSTPVTVELMFE